MVAICRTSNRSLFRNIQFPDIVLSLCGLAKYLNFSCSLPSNCVFTNSLYVFTTDRWDLYAVVQSTLTRSLGSQIQRFIGNTATLLIIGLFRNLSFPRGTVADCQSKAGGNRRTLSRTPPCLMLRLWQGLTNIYNLFHTRDLTPAMSPRSVKNLRMKQKLATGAFSNCAACIANWIWSSGTPTAGLTSTWATTSTKSKPCPKTTASATPSAPLPARKSCVACWPLTTTARPSKPLPHLSRKNAAKKLPNLITPNTDFFNKLSGRWIVCQIVRLIVFFERLFVSPLTQDK